MIKKINLTSGALIGVLLTAPLIGIMYLADQLLDLPFVPFDLFDLLTRVLPGPLITFGIDLMIDTMRWLGVSVADTAKTAEQFLAVLQFFFGGIASGVVSFGFFSMRSTRPDTIAGIVMGALFGMPFIAISIAIGQSIVSPILQIMWLSFLFLAWGISLSKVYGRLVPGEAEVSTGSEEIRAVKKINRRQFLVRLGSRLMAVPGKM
jgi:hypothetical protein